VTHHPGDVKATGGTLTYGEMAIFSDNTDIAKAVRDGE
jgi:hypothetical protein